MVRSPVAASRKRRIESSSEELEDVSIKSPRKSKLRKVSLASPDSSSNGARELPEEEAEQPALENDGSGSSSSNASQGGNEAEEDEEDAEYQEKLQIWEMFADEYHDSESFAFGPLLRLFQDSKLIVKLLCKTMKQS